MIDNNDMKLEHRDDTKDRLFKIINNKDKVNELENEIYNKCDTTKAYFAKKRMLIDNLNPESYIKNPNLLKRYLNLKKYYLLQVKLQMQVGLLFLV